MDWKISYGIGRKCRFCRTKIVDNCLALEGNNTNGDPIFGHEECVDAQEAFVEWKGWKLASTLMPESLKEKNWIRRHYPEAAGRLRWSIEMDLPPLGKRPKKPARPR